MPRGYCPKHEGAPCTCAMGHLYRFVEPVVLLMLKQKGATHGYDLAGAVAAHALTDAAIDRGALYRTLNVLEANGCVTSEWQTGSAGPARRVYQLTSRGEEHLQEWTTVLERLGGALLRFAEEAKRS